MYAKNFKKWRIMGAKFGSYHIYFFVKSASGCLVTNKFANNINWTLFNAEIWNIIFRNFLLYCHMTPYILKEEKLCFNELSIHFFKIYELDHRNCPVLFEIFITIWYRLTFNINNIYNNCCDIRAELRINLELPEINYLSAINNALTIILAFSLNTF